MGIYSFVLQGKYATYVFTACLFLGACSSTSSELKIVSIPEGARVLDSEGKEVGVTPLAVKPIGKNMMNFELRKAGFETQKVAVDLHSFEEISVQLKSLGEQAFSDHVIKEYGNQMHTMVSKFLKLQGLIGTKQKEKANSMIEEVMGAYSEVAASHVLAADLALLNKNIKKARESLLQAAKLAPEDVEVKAALKRLGVATL